MYTTHDSYFDAITNSQSFSEHLLKRSRASLIQRKDTEHERLKAITQTFGSKLEL